MSPSAAIQTDADADERTRLARRSRECRHRDGLTCRLLSSRLGWRTAVSWSVCDDCFTGRAPVVPTIERAHIKGIMARPCGGWTETVALRIAERHGSIRAAMDFVIGCAGQYERRFLMRMMNAVLERARRVGIADSAIRRFIDRMDDADQRSEGVAQIPRTREEWRSHPACGELISRHCERCPDFSWTRRAVGDVGVRCRRFGCPTECRKKFLDPTISCPRGYSRG